MGGDLLRERIKMQLQPKKRDAGQGLQRFRNILRVGRFTPPPSTLLCQTKAPRDRIFFGIFTSFPLITKFTSDYYLKERERRKFLNKKESQFCKLLDIVFAFFLPSAFPSSFMTRHGLSLRTHRIQFCILPIAQFVDTGLHTALCKIIIIIIMINIITIIIIIIIIIINIIMLNARYSIEFVSCDIKKI